MLRGAAKCVSVKSNQDEQMTTFLIRSWTWMYPEVVHSTKPSCENCKTIGSDDKAQQEYR